MSSAMPLSPSITLIDEPCYSFSSADNSRRYEREYLLEKEHRPSSIHGVLLDEVPLAVFGTSGGRSSVHSHSGAIVEGHLYVAVGDHLACFDLGQRELLWAKKVDDATCYGVFYSESHHALFCHGELSVSRIDLDGTVAWFAFGDDIFTGTLQLGHDCVKVTDCNGRERQFSYVDGHDV